MTKSGLTTATGVLNVTSLCSFCSRECETLRDLFILFEMYESIRWLRAVGLCQACCHEYDTFWKRLQRFACWIDDIDQSRWFVASTSTLIPVSMSISGGGGTLYKVELNYNVIILLTVSRGFTRLLVLKMHHDKRIKRGGRGASAGVALE